MTTRRHRRSTTSLVLFGCPAAAAIAFLCLALQWGKMKVSRNLASTNSDRRSRLGGLAALGAAVAVLTSAGGLVIAGSAHASSRVIGPLSPPAGVWLGATSDNYGAPYSDAQWE